MKHPNVTIAQQQAIGELLANRAVISSADFGRRVADYIASLDTNYEQAEVTAWIVGELESRWRACEITSWGLSHHTWWMNENVQLTVLPDLSGKQVIFAAGIRPSDKYKVQYLDGKKWRDVLEDEKFYIHRGEHRFRTTEID